MHYREIRGGSIATQICNYNGRADCFLNGKFSLFNPRPVGHTCGEFVQLCSAANRVAENKLLPYRAEEILTYSGEGWGSSQGNRLNERSVCLVDFYLEHRNTGNVKMKFFIDPEEAYEQGKLPEEQELVLPFLYIPILHFVVEVEIGDIASQRMAVCFTKNGALIYELSVVSYTPKRGG